MKPMTASDFSRLKIRDFENSAVLDEIYFALKEREKLIEKKPKVTREWIKDRAKEFYLSSWKEWETMIEALIRRKEIGVEVEK